MARPRAALLACLLATLLGLATAAENSRDGVFVGYKEAGVDGEAGVGGEDGGDGGDGSLHAADAATEGVTGVHVADAAAEGDTGVRVAGGDAGAAADDSAAATEQAAAGGTQGGDQADAAVAEELGRTVVLHTQFGPIRVKLLEKLAPRTTAMVWALAKKRGCRACSFYRNEARPRAGEGPPYALLQGRLDMPEAAPREGNIEVKMGHVCFIPDTKDFFIAYGDHPEWGTSHTVWGVVDEWFATDFIVSQQYTETTHPEFGTVMRMLKQEVPLRIATADDSFYSGLLGPMHYDEPPL